MRKAFHRGLARVNCCIQNKGMAKANILNKAILAGDENVVRSLIAEGADVDHLLGMRGTALCAAIGAKQSAIASLLIESGCGVNVEDWDREPPLHLAIRKGCMDVAQKLIRHPRCNLDKSDPLTKAPAICYAAGKGVADVVRWMLEAGCNTKAKDVSDNTALHLAVKNGHLEVVKLLVGQGVHCLFNEMGMAPVHLAAQAGNVRVFLLLLSEFVDPNTDNVDNFIIPSSARIPIKQIVNLPKKYSNSSVTPIEYAAVGKHVAMVKFLLRCGANPNLSKTSLQFPKSLPPLLRACTYYIADELDLTMAEHLLDAGADTEMGGKLMIASFGSRPVTPLQYAAKKNSVKLVEFLVKRGADVNNNTHGEAPLFVALTNRSLDVAWYLMKECTSLDFRVLDAKKRNLLHAMISFDSVTETENVMTFLLEKGCDVNNFECEIEDGGCAPVHTAITEQNKVLLEALVRHGADVNLKSRGLTPLHHCAMTGDTETADFLLSSGADVDLVSDAGQSALALALEYDDEDHLLFAKFVLDRGCYVSTDLICEVEEEGEDIRDEGDSDSSSYETDEASLKSTVQNMINARASVPRPLVDFCLHTIRKHFISNRIHFSSALNLQLPKRLTDAVLYKT